MTRGARGLLTVAALAVALAAADTYVVVLALTDMMAGVGVGIESLQRATPIISGFLLGYIAVLPLIGRLSDLVDRRRILLWCLVIFVVGSAVTAAAVELPVMVGEKGCFWVKLRVLGTPGHGSMPFGADNALITYRLNGKPFALAELLGQHSRPLHDVAGRHRLEQRALGPRLRRHHRHAFSSQVTGRAWIGLPSR